MKSNLQGVASEGPLGWRCSPSNSPLGESLCPRRKACCAFASAWASVWLCSFAARVCAPGALSHACASPVLTQLSFSLSFCPCWDRRTPVWRLTAAQLALSCSLVNQTQDLCSAAGWSKWISFLLGWHSFRISRCVTLAQNIVKSNNVSKMDFCLLPSHFLAQKSGQKYQLLWFGVSSS